MRPKPRRDRPPRQPGHQGHRQVVENRAVPTVHVAGDPPGQFPHEEERPEVRVTPEHRHVPRRAEDHEEEQQQRPAQGAPTRPVAGGRDTDGETRERDERTSGFGPPRQRPAKQRQEPESPRAAAPAALGPRRDGQGTPSAEQHVRREHPAQQPELEGRSANEHRPPRHPRPAPPPGRPAEAGERQGGPGEGGQPRGPLVDAEHAEAQGRRPVDQRRLVVVAPAGEAGFPPVAARQRHRARDGSVAALIGFVEAPRPEAKGKEQQQRTGQQQPVAGTRKSAWRSNGDADRQRFHRDAGWARRRAALSPPAIADWMLHAPVWSPASQTLSR